MDPALKLSQIPSKVSLRSYMLLMWNYHTWTFIFGLEVASWVGSVGVGGGGPHCKQLPKAKHANLG